MCSNISGCLTNGLTITKSIQIEEVKAMNTNWNGQFIQLSLYWNVCIYQWTTGYDIFWVCVFLCQVTQYQKQQNPYTQLGQKSKTMDF